MEARMAGEREKGQTRASESENGVDEVILGDIPRVRSIVVKLSMQSVAAWADEAKRGNQTRVWGDVESQAITHRQRRFHRYPNIFEKRLFLLH